MAAQLISVNFHDQSLAAAVLDGKPYVAMKPICENLGLQWRAQYHRIKRHPVLNQVVSMTDTTSYGQDGKTYNAEMLMLPLDYLNGWLFGIDISRIKEELKPRLMEYQRMLPGAGRSLPTPARRRQTPAQTARRRLSELRLSALALAHAAPLRLHGSADLPRFLPLRTLRPPRGPAALPTQTRRPRRRRRGRPIQPAAVRRRNHVLAARRTARCSKNWNAWASTSAWLDRFGSLVGLTALLTQPAHLIIEFRQSYITPASHQSACPGPWRLLPADPGGKHDANRTSDPLAPASSPGAGPVRPCGCLVSSSPGKRSI
jgi:hypothetical protein